MPLTWSSTNSMASSTKAWRRPGTPDGGAAHHPPEEAEGEHAEQHGDGHRIDVQHPEVARTDRLLKKTQMVADVGSRGQRVIQRRTCQTLEEIQLITETAKARPDEQDRNHEGSQERQHHHVAVDSETQPEQQNDRRRSWPPRRARPCGRRRRRKVSDAARQQREYQQTDDADGAAEHRRQQTRACPRADRPVQRSLPQPAPATPWQRGTPGRCAAGS